MNEKQRDLAQVTLGVIFIGGLIAASLWILWPFLAAVIWATMVVVATWPLMLGVEARLWRKRWLAVTVMTLTLLLVLVVPLSMAVAALIDNADRIVSWARMVAEFEIPREPPEAIAALPMVGDRLAALWHDYAGAGLHELTPLVTPYATKATLWFASEVSSFGMIVLQFLLTVGIAALMYAGGDSAAGWLKRFGHRLAGTQGENAVVLASQAIRGVALGVVVTALAQSVIGGVGLAIAGVPMASVLTVLMFVLCIAQLGPVLVLVPAVAWLYWSGDNGWGTFLLVWTLIVGTLDNVLRPYLIRKGADLPLILIFAGVIGGMVTFGLVGIFVGPVVLAVAFTLIDAWVGDGKQPRTTAASHKANS
jgi:predicted PurR-regulated permease PerM